MRTPIKAGSRVRYLKSKDSLIQTGKYTTIKYIDGCIYTVIDDDGGVYMVNKDDVIHSDDYDEWLNDQTNQPKSKTMDALEAMQAMVAGKKVRRINWDNSKYLHIGKENVFIVNQENVPYSFCVTAHYCHEEWEEYVEPVKVWKVGDKLSSSIDGCSYIVLYADEDVIFCKSINGTSYSCFSKKNNIELLTYLG